MQGHEADDLIAIGLYFFALYRFATLSFELMLLWVTLWCLCLYALLIGYYVYYWYRVPVFIPAQASPHLFVSVVVAARNEEQNISLLLEALSGQTLSPDQFEVIIVDDFSTDNTALAVKRFTSDRICLIQPTTLAEQSSKKKAIEAGVAKARGPLIAITDADCRPQPQWLELLLACFQHRQPAFVVAPVQLTTKGSLLGIFQVLDFLMLQGITAASVQAGAHSMCNGANLAYEKKAFLEAGGFAGVDARASGDDMLLLYKIWRRHPHRIHYLKNAAAVMPTPALTSWRAFLQQRIRWSSKATYYQDKRVSAVLFFVYAFNLWCLVLCIAGLLQQVCWQLAVGCVAAKAIIELFLLLPVARFYNQAQMVWCFPLLQPWHILYTVVVGLLSRKGTYTWKGRITR